MSIDGASNRTRRLRDRAAERIFNLDPAIRYVGIVDLDYHVILSRMRPGLSSLTPTEADWNFISMVPKVMGGGTSARE